MNIVTLYLIKIIHLILFLLIVVVPFTNKVPLLFMYSFCIPFLLSHWGLNNDVCSLTVAEEILTKKIYGEYDESECITCQIIKPVYKLVETKEQFSGIIWTITLILWMIVMFKLYYMVQNKRITNVIDLFLW
jgi:hypothetical protein